MRSRIKKTKMVINFSQFVYKSKQQVINILLSKQDYFVFAKRKKFSEIVTKIFKYFI